MLKQENVYGVLGTAVQVSRVLGFLCFIMFIPCLIFYERAAIVLAIVGFVLVEWTRGYNVVGTPDIDAPDHCEECGGSTYHERSCSQQTWREASMQRSAEHHAEQHNKPICSGCGKIEPLCECMYRSVGGRT